MQGVISDMIRTGDERVEQHFCMAMNLVWFRNDLRTEDNPALWHACQDRRAVVGLFILTPEQWRSHDMAGCRVEFLLSTLKVLRQNLTKIGIPLQVIRGDTFANVADQILNFCQKQSVGKVFWNNEYPVDEVVRDRSVEVLLSARGIDVARYHDRVLLPPDCILTQQDQPYKVFTPFKNKLLSQLDQGWPDLFPVPETTGKTSIELNEIPGKLSGFNSQVDLSRWPAGEMHARERLESFLCDGIENYLYNRDFPAIGGTSSLSPYLAVGSLSPRQCLLAALSGPQSGGVDAWINELVWRDFYQYIAWHFPRVCKHKPFNLATESVAWRDDAAAFEAWTEGNTGVPLVDAGMRQLRQTGWMHNRARMVTAMFLSKNLLLDWRHGEKFFMNHLVDGDFTANNGGWQWSASTGTDAAPYFRVFNPFSQARKFDPQASYIKSHVPELRGLDAADINNPVRLQKAKPREYPEMIVDLKSSRELAISAFRERGD